MALQLGFSLAVYEEFPIEINEYGICLGLKNSFRGITLSDI